MDVLYLNTHWLLLSHQNPVSGKEILIEDKILIGNLDCGCYLNIF